MSTPEYLSDQWLDGRRRLRLFFCVPFIGFLAICGLVTALPPPNIVTYSALIIWAIASVVVSFRLMLFSCPACTKPFFFKGFAYPFTTKCVYCGLKKYEN